MQIVLQIVLDPDAKTGDKISLICKATDASYNVQPESPESVWNIRGLNNNSWHEVQVTEYKSNSKFKVWFGVGPGRLGVEAMNSINSNWANRYLYFFKYFLNQSRRCLHDYPYYKLIMSGV